MQRSGQLVIITGILLMVTGCGSQQTPQKPPPSESPLQFSLEHVTELAGLGDFKHVTGAVGEKWFPETMGAGAAFFDADGDSWLDILLVSGATWEDENPTPALSLFHNNQDGTFSDVTTERGLANLHAYGFGVAAADYDNDGDADIAFTTLKGTKLLQNNDGVFSDVSTAAGLSDHQTMEHCRCFF